ncbi:basic proline-rich protein-like [Pithys albifrons albifrons]|uniref:basic proline-rich protein-like n=1 Tax=Pithys albifrons albifrons TaxID=3385563 RepID=UPI003A5CBE90
MVLRNPAVRISPSTASPPLFLRSVLPGPVALCGIPSLSAGTSPAPGCLVPVPTRRRGGGASWGRNPLRVTGPPANRMSGHLRAGSVETDRNPRQSKAVPPARRRGQLWRDPVRLTGTPTNGSPRPGREAVPAAVPPIGERGGLRGPQCGPGGRWRRLLALPRGSALAAPARPAAGPAPPSASPLCPPCPLPARPPPPRPSAPHRPSGPAAPAARPWPGALGSGGGWRRRARPRSPLGQLHIPSYSGLPQLSISSLQSTAGLCRPRETPSTSLGPPGSSQGLETTPRGLQVPPGTPKDPQRPQETPRDSHHRPEPSWDTRGPPRNIRDAKQPQGSTGTSFFHAFELHNLLYFLFYKSRKIKRGAAKPSGFHRRFRDSIIFHVVFLIFLYFGFYFILFIPLLPLQAVQGCLACRARWPRPRPASHGHAGHAPAPADRAVEAHVWGGAPSAQTPVQIPPSAATSTSPAPPHVHGRELQRSPALPVGYRLFLYSRVFTSTPPRSDLGLAEARGIRLQALGFLCFLSLQPSCRGKG